MYARANSPAQTAPTLNTVRLLTAMLHCTLQCSVRAYLCDREFRVTLLAAQQFDQLCDFCARIRSPRCNNLKRKKMHSHTHTTHRIHAVCTEEYESHSHRCCRRRRMEIRRVGGRRLMPSGQRPMRTDRRTGERGRVRSCDVCDVCALNAKTVINTFAQRTHARSQTTAQHTYLQSYRRSDDVSPRTL